LRPYVRYPLPTLSYIFLLQTRSFHFPFFSIATPTPETYTLSLHDALPILFVYDSGTDQPYTAGKHAAPNEIIEVAGGDLDDLVRSEEHTSELQSQSNLVCRLLLEKKKQKKNHITRLRAPTYGRQRPQTSDR